MRKLRVGTLSMGVALIILGLIMLVSLIGGYTIASKLITWWPLLLIMIGVEILFFIYRSKEEQLKVKYDVFSIFMILCIFVISGVFYGITSTGVIQQVATAVNSRDYAVVIPHGEIALRNHITKVIITVPNNSLLEISKSEGSNIIYKGTSDVFAKSPEMAKEIIDKEEVYFTEVGDTLYIQLPTFEKKQDIRTGIHSVNYMLYLPEELDVELKGANSYASKVVINGGAVSGNWWIDNVNTQINGDSNSNFELEAVTEYQHHLKGNVDWKEEEDNNGYITGKVTLGNGNHRIRIRKSNVEVLYLP